MSRLQADDTLAPRLVSSFGHAAFDFIESRSGKAGVRQFLFALRQAASNGADPFQAALQLRRNEFDQAFESYFRDRFAAASPLPASRLDQAATTRVEGDITSVGWPVATGLACIELWVPDAGAARQLWAVECGTASGQDLIRALRPGDRVVVDRTTSSRSHGPAVDARKPDAARRWPDLASVCAVTVNPEPLNPEPT